MLFRSVQVGVGTGDKVLWSPRFHGAMRAPMLFDWIDQQTPAKGGSFDGALRNAMRHFTERGLLIIMSDFWAMEIQKEVNLLFAAGQEIWGMHILTPQEIDPARFGDGEVRMVDSEDGQEVEVTLDGGIRRGSDVVKAVALGARGRRRAVYGTRPDPSLVEPRLALQRPAPRRIPEPLIHGVRRSANASRARRRAGAGRVIRRLTNAPRHRARSRQTAAIRRRDWRGRA